LLADVTCGKNEELTYSCEGFDKPKCTHAECA
jgi:hypothetical protein